MGIVNAQQVIEDVYEDIDKELLVYVEDVLLNRRDDATERLLEYSQTLEPKSHPTAVRRKGGIAANPLAGLPPKENPVSHDTIAPIAGPPVPIYKQWVDPLEKTPAFATLEEAFSKRMMFIDGAMGTAVQKFKL